MPRQHSSQKDWHAAALDPIFEETTRSNVHTRTYTGTGVGLLLELEVGFVMSFDLVLHYPRV